MPFARPLLLVLMALVASTAAAQASRRLDDCTRSQVRLSVSIPGIAFTGGSYEVSVNLRNVSRSGCNVEGHPVVVVSPHPFPIAVGDLADFDPNVPERGPERVAHLRPGRSVYAVVIIARRCAGAVGQLTRTTITFWSY